LELASELPSLLREGVCCAAATTVPASTLAAASAINLLFIFLHPLSVICYSALQLQAAKKKTGETARSSEKSMAHVKF